MKAPIADSDPARYFSLPGGPPHAEQLQVQVGQVPVDPHRGLVPGRDVRHRVAEQRVEAPQQVQVERPERVPLGRRTARPGRAPAGAGTTCTSNGQRAAAGTNAVQCSLAATTRSRRARSAASTSAKRLRPPVASACRRAAREHRAGARRDERVGVDLAVRVVQGHPDLDAPVLEAEHLLHAGQGGQLGGPVGQRVQHRARPGPAASVANEASWSEVKQTTSHRPVPRGWSSAGSVGRRSAGCALKEGNRFSKTTTS